MTSDQKIKTPLVLGNVGGLQITLLSALLKQAWIEFSHFYDYMICIINIYWIWLDSFNEGFQFSFYMTRRYIRCIYLYN